MRSLKSLLSGVLAAVLLLASGLAVAVPEIQHWRTANGVPVYFIPARELPMVDAQILFSAGSVRDDGKPGLAKLTNALLEEGAGDWSADDIADRLDRVGARFSASSRRDSAVLSLRSLADPRYLQPAVETVARLLKEPTFAPDAVERVRQQMLTVLQERAQSPGAIAQDAFFKALYGNHPYATPPEGTTASLNALTRADLQDFHRRHYTAANAVVALVGDLDRPAAESLANALVGNLPKGELIPPPPPVPPIPASQTLRIPHPSSQSHILIGQVGVSRADPDYYALYLGNHVLGGNGLVSQLSQEIREKRGLAYGAYSAFSPMRQAGPFLMNLQTRNDQVDTALEVAQTTLREFTAKGPESLLLEEARQNITGGFALDIAGNGKLANSLGSIAFYGLPLDYLQNFISVMNSINLEQVKSAWQRHLQPDRLITVIVGGQPAASASPGAPGA
jgi:zinc protease